MDNITHTLTGAIASKAGPQHHHTRVVFWVLILSANLPDIDFIMQFFGDRMFYIEQHRGLSHSIFFAPVLAAFVSWILKLSVNGLNFGFVFKYVLIGIYIHIWFDLITSFGTMIFYPITDARYTLDLIFIIDPWLTGLMILILIVAKIYNTHRRFFIWIGIILICCYFLIAFANREIVRTKAHQFFMERNINIEEIIVLPQPLALTNWMVLVKSDDAAYQIFTNSFQGTDDYQIIDYPFLEPNEYILRAEETEKVKFFRWFSRMPVYDYYEEEGKHIVEYYDLQFVLNPRLAERFNITATSPFTLQIVFDDDGTIIDHDF